MSENNEDELVLGLIPPRTFLQVAAMLPAITIGSSLVVPFLGISFGAAGLMIFFFIILRSLLDRRKLPAQIWLMAAAQALAAAYVLHQHGFELAAMLGA
ncbi:MAG: hypothetical protein ACNA8W_23840 [Bradymonadaceae bacterium]